MQLHIDLHSHSAFAGGARAGGNSSDKKQKNIKKRFIESALYAPLKGVNLLGTGDVQFEPWMEFLESNLIEKSNGIFSYNFTSTEINEFTSKEIKINLDKAPEYILQSEVIFTGPVPNSKRKKRTHVVLLFPHFESVKEFNNMLDRCGVARKNMARPFIVSDTLDEVEKRTNEIFDINEEIEVIPAHVMTPEGIYGGNERINFLHDFFGSASDRIKIVETGLSADPEILGLIPELDKRVLISNADAHSSALNRVGREFTTLEINKKSYPELIRGLRNNKITKTAEFHPTEGRYFLTGHRPDRKQPIHGKDQFCIYSPKNVPANDICPICGKTLTIGVLQRAFEVCSAQGEDRNIGDGPKRDFITMVPLIEIIAYTNGVSTLTSKKLLKEYQSVINYIETETNLWINESSLFKLKTSNINQNLISNIIEIKKGNFCFSPSGYDGTYGSLVIGKTEDYNDVSLINY
jgi:PHP family Zn ribbon phosphoesterase